MPGRTERGSGGNDVSGLTGPVRPVHLSGSRAVMSVSTTARSQVIRIGPGEARFEGWCERCLDDPTPQSLGLRWLRVDGELPLEVDAGLTSCRRGHRIAVRRLGRLTDAA